MCVHLHIYVYIRRPLQSVERVRLHLQAPEQAASQQGSKAARQPGSQAARQQGRKAASQPGSGS